MSVSSLLLPPPANLFQNSSFAVRGDALYVASDDHDMFWTFSLSTGRLLHPGLFLPGPGLASNPVTYGTDLVVLTGWFPTPSIMVIDTSNEAAPRIAGRIEVPEGASVQGLVPLTANGTVGFIGSFSDDRIYSFDARALTLLDADGLLLPGNPDRTTLAGTKEAPLVVLVDTQNGGLMVVDASSPRELRLVGSVRFPAPTSFSSANRPFTASDGRTVFVVSQERKLWAIDAPTATLLDPDGVSFGRDGAGLTVALDDSRQPLSSVAARRTAVALGQQGAAVIDATNPRELRVVHEVDFAGPALVQGDADAVFSADGSLVAVPLIGPAMSVVAVDVAGGRVTGDPVLVGEQPNAMSLLADGRLAVMCSGQPDGIWLIGGLLDAVATPVSAPSE